MHWLFDILIVVFLCVIAILTDTDILERQNKNFLSVLKVLIVIIAFVFLVIDNLS
ncbi:hypothetical protein [Bacillus sp. AFS096315]|uniref:hypothetical protein n=1 Tax=Bacillus sp. AFS096315 TaxID=2033517 RepID=UPI0015968BF6|nr:hypothetical protein [Bacillus sp. AFS096315]